MKKILHIAIMSVLCALVFSCAKETSNPDAINNQVILTFTSERPQIEDVTRTEWNGETVVWSGGDKIRVGYTLNGDWMNKSTVASGDAKFYASEEVSIDSGDATIGTFDVPIGDSSFTDPNAEGNYVFYAVFPSNSTGATASAAPVVDVTLPATQTPAESSFDKLADIMVGKTAAMSLSGLPTSAIEIVWNRLVAHADLTFINMDFDGTENITSITLTATDGAKLAGNISVDVSDGSITTENAGSSIKLNGDNLSANGSSIEAWCGILPATITALDVEIKTDKATYTRSISGISKTFKKNARNTLRINMASAHREESVSSNFALFSGSITEGDYLIVYDNGAMKAEVASNRLKYSEVSPVGDVISTTDESIIWHIAASGDYWTIFNAAEEKYAAATGSNNQAQLLASGADDKSLWSVSGNSTYEFSNKARAAASSNNRYLRRNTTYGFACYANSTGGELSLYKRDTRTPLDAPASVTASLNSSANNAIDVTFSTVTNAGSYVITATPTTGAPVTKSVASSPATIADLAYSTEYTISVYAVPNNTTTYRNSAATSASGSVTTGSAPVSTGYAKLSSVNDVTTADYVIAAKVGDEYYAMSNTFGNKNSATLVTVTNGVISTSDATNYVVTITKNNNQYSISNGEEILGYSGSSTNFSTSATGNAALWTVSAGTKGSFRIANVGTNTRAICLKSDATPIVFGAYATSNVTAAQTDYYDVELFKYNGAVKTEPTTTVTPASPIALNVGSTQQLTVVTDSDGAVSYASSADGVATVSSTGLITAVSTGSATITVSTAATNTYYASTTTITVNVSNPAGNDGSQAHPFTVAEVRAYMDASESNRGPVYIQGIVSSVYAEYDQAHGTGIFYISDDGETNSAQFEAYSVKFLANNAWVNGNTQIAVGDEVIIYGGELAIFNTSTYETKQNSGSYLYSLNSSTAETVPTINVTDITGVAAAGVSGATKSVTFSNNSGWTASVDKDGTVVTAASISGTTITYTVSANTGDARNGSITVKLSKSGRTDAIAVITVGQLAGNGSTSETVSFTSSSSGGMTATAGAQSGTKNGVTIEITQGVATSGQIRIYKSATITISAPTGKKITEIEFTCTESGTTKYGPGCFNSATGYSYSGYVGTWTGNSSSVSLTAGSNQVRATEIKVTFE